MTAPVRVPASTLRTLRFGREVHLDHYGGGRLPFAVLGGQGLRQRFVELAGAHAGTAFEAIDASGGYASACLGAGSEVARQALDRAVREVGYATDELESLERARLLYRLFGPDGLWADHFPTGQYHASGRNSGSEGMELALRLLLESRVDSRTLRPTGTGRGRDLILAFEGAWHGWTGGVTPLLNRGYHRAGLPRLSPDGPGGVTVEFLPFGTIDLVESYCADKGDRLLGVVVEPVQGDAGILLPPRGYLRRLAELCRTHGALLVADEVLTFAKTGRFFAMSDEQGPVPTDVTVVGKSIGMGVLSTSMVMARRTLTVRGSGAVATSDLRPLTCAVVHDGLSHIVHTGLLARSADLGRHLAQRLQRELVEEFPDLYRQTRGTGVIHGVELTERAAARLADLRVDILRAGVYVEFMAGAGRRSGGLRYVFPTMRVAPPLIATTADVDEIVGRVAEGSRVFGKGAP